MSAVEEIRIKLEQRLTELEAEIESLRSALTALDDQEAAAQSGEAPAAPPAKTPRARGRGRRSARASAPATRNGGNDGSSSAELEKLLAEMGGMSAVELARQTGTEYSAVLARIRQLEEAGQRRR